MAYGLWLMAYGLWLMAYGLWLMAYGLWLMAYQHFKDKKKQESLHFPASDYLNLSALFDSRTNPRFRVRL